jgi:hypothetical protein
VSEYESFELPLYSVSGDFILAERKSASAVTKCSAYSLSDLLFESILLCGLRTSSWCEKIRIKILSVESNLGLGPRPRCLFALDNLAALCFRFDLCMALLRVSCFVGM